MIPDEALPFDMLRRADADIQMKVGALTSGGTVYRDIAGHLLLQDGKLRLDPFAAVLPGGRMELKLSADATEAAPPVSVAMRAPGLALKPLLAVLGLPDDASGVVDVDLDLRGAGRTPHAIAAGMDGHAGLSMVNGRIENRLIAETIGQALREANLPDFGVRGGNSEVRCFAARLDAVHGVAQLRALLLDATLVHMEGAGSVNLGDETLALRLEPLARVGGIGVMVPLRVGGTFRKPKATVDAVGAAGEAARLAEGASGKGGPLLGIVIGALGADRMIAGAGRGGCAEQLAIARGGRAGPLPASAPAPAPTGDPGAGKPKIPKPADLLRQFLR
jgi:AsmA protein